VSIDTYSFSYFVDQILSSKPGSDSILVDNRIGIQKSVASNKSIVENERSCLDRMLDRN
jgi:hypothetical protein